jgi:hypothetical protein
VALLGSRRPPSPTLRWRPASGTARGEPPPGGSMTKATAMLDGSPGLGVVREPDGWWCGMSSNYALTVLRNY